MTKAISCGTIRGSYTVHDKSGGTADTMVCCDDEGVISFYFGPLIVVDKGDELDDSDDNYDDDSNDIDNSDLDDEDNSRIII